MNKTIANLSNRPSLSPVKTTIIIPVHNEEENIGRLLDSLKNIIEDDWEIIVVDDGSGDKTASVCKEKGVAIISHPYCIGNGAAIKTGIRNASGNVLVMMDGDGQHRPEDIPRLLEGIDRYDMVVGARPWRSQSGWSRGLANRLYNVFASYVAHKKISDLTSGFRAIKRKIAMKYLYMLPNTFSYPTTLTLGLMKSGHSVSFVPIEAGKRKGVSKIKPFRDGVRFLLIITRIATVFSPFRVFLPISIFLFLSGVSYYLYWFFTVGRFTNMALLLLLLSVIVFLMGLISEQITQLRYDRTEG
ncbi:MAG: glycosyltransferase family 2 protein [Thermodesulfobacteriota bacterium]